MIIIIHCVIEFVFQKSSHFQHWCFCWNYLGPFTFCTSNVAPFPIYKQVARLLLTTWLESPQELRRTCSFLLLFTATGASKTTPQHVGTSYTHNIGFTAREMSQLPTRLRGSLTLQILWVVRRSLFETPLNGVQPL